MRLFLNKNYDINCIGIIQINESVYRIKTIKNDYILKLTRYCNIEVFDYIDSMNLSCFVSVIKNNKGHYLTNYKNEYCYLMKSVELDIDLYCKEKERFYYEMMKLFHNKTRCMKLINAIDLSELINRIEITINKRINYYDDLMSYYENNEYRSPVGWMFVLNFYRIDDILNKSKELLYLFKSKKDIQLSYCLIYSSFHFDHISLKNQCLISIDHLSKNLLIYDLYDIFKNIPLYHLDIHLLNDLYIGHMNFNENEYILIMCLMCLIPEISLQQSEMNNIMSLSYLLDYIDSIHAFLDKLLTK